MAYDRPQAAAQMSNLVGGLFFLFLIIIVFLIISHRRGPQYAEECQLNLIEINNEIGTRTDSFLNTDDLQITQSGDGTTIEFLDFGWECPSGGNYAIETDGIRVVCTSGLPGHSLGGY